MRRVVCIAAALLALTPAGRSDSVAPIAPAACQAMQLHHVLAPGAPVGCERLRLVTFSYLDFDGRSHDDGAIVVLDAVAPSVQRIFATLFERRFAIAKAAPMEAYDGDDEAAMEGNNTSSLNFRPVTGGSDVSLHGYGAAIDLNPVQNPFIARMSDHPGTLIVHPAGGVAYLNRAPLRPGKPGRAGLAEEVVDLFAENGFFRWGGDWDDPIDYQHFDIGRPLAKRLIALAPDRALAVFEAAIAEYHHCVSQMADKTPAEQRAICANVAVH
jgi:hypothetical protein